MTMGSVISWILCGLVVGLLARFLMPGRQSMSVPMTVVLGIVGALVGGFLSSLFWGASSDPFSLSGNAWHGWIVSILGAILLLLLYPSMYPRRWWQ